MARSTLKLRNEEVFAAERPGSAGSLGRWGPLIGMHVKPALIIIGILVVLAIAAAGEFVSVRNELVAQREAVNAAWSEVDVALERRADLIPKLVETVKRYAKQETAIFKDIADERAALVSGRTPQEKIQANDQLSNALSRLLVVVEDYPQLKSNQNFLRLQDELAGTENRIAVERRKYNETLQHYNTSIQVFPNNLVARMSRFSRNDAYFRAEPEASKAPRVAF